MRGATVAIVHPPIGPACCVQTAAGALIRGHRVPDDYAGPDTVFRGRCVRFRRVGRGGEVVVNADGEWQTSKSANGWAFADLEGTRIEIRDAVPPELAP